MNEQPPPYVLSTDQGFVRSAMVYPGRIHAVLHVAYTPTSRDALRLCTEAVATGVCDLMAAHGLPVPTVLMVGTPADVSAVEPRPRFRGPRC